MAHFAKVINGRVEEVIVADQEFVDQIKQPGEQWIQTSYNTFGGVHLDPETRQPSNDQSKALRYNFASVGGFYDSTADAFFNPKPFKTWVLDKTTYMWKPPVPFPQDGNSYSWNDEDAVWELMSEIEEPYPDDGKFYTWDGSKWVESEKGL